MARPAIGFISPFWLPMWGGAEQYHSRLAAALIGMGESVRVFCGVAATPGMDNGNIPVERHVPKSDIEPANWMRVLRAPSEQELEKLSRHFEFMEAAVKWAKASGIDVALIGSPFNHFGCVHARELYRRLSDLGIRVGLIHHDLPSPVSKDLQAVYLSQPGGWEQATRTVVGRLRGIFKGGDRMKSALVAGSPLCFEPDFIITNTHWSAPLIDPLDECPKFVLHPLMEAGFWSGRPAPDMPLGKVDMMMVNPQSRKNPELMGEMISRMSDARRFRVLQGGWGDAFKEFRPVVERLPASTRRNVELVDYLPDMRSAYQSSGLLVSPSFEEGYGMTPVEAMYCGTAVLSSNFPAILEAVGDGALTLCPYRDPAERWIAAAEQILADPAPWRARAVARGRVLAQRQSQEIAQLTEFLSQIAA